MTTVGAGDSRSRVSITNSIREVRERDIVYKDLEW